MAFVMCDHCKKNYDSKEGSIRKLFSLDICYKCGNFEKNPFEDDYEIVNTSVNNSLEKEEILEIENM